MKNNYNNLYLLSKSLIKFLIAYRKQKKYFKNFNDLQKILSEAKYAIRGYNLFRIKDYAIRLYALICDVFDLESYHKITEIEHRNLSLLMAFIPLYDDFLEDTKDEISRLKILARMPDYYIPINRKEKAGYDILMLLLAAVKDDIKRVFPIIYKTHLAQIDSHKQSELDTKLTEIEKLTKNKGGYSLILCRSLINKPFISGEYQIWYQYGVLTQLLDDVFDAKKDFDEGLRTFITEAKNLDDVDAFLEKNYLELIHLIRNSGYSDDLKQQFIQRVALIYIAGKGKLYLFKRFKKKFKNFSFDKINRKQYEMKLFSIANFAYSLKLALKLNLKSE